MITINEIKKFSCFKDILGGEVKNILSVSTDSRKITKDNIFVALRGEKFDGHDYLLDCHYLGCKYFVIEGKKNYLEKVSKILENDPRAGFIVATNTEEYLAELAKNYIKYLKEKSDLKVICITGSNGKTTTKDMVAHLLNSAFPGLVHKTAGNFNNQIGLPLTILNLKPEHKFAVLEIGMNHPGEINRLCEIAQPEAGIITMIGDAHIEFMGTRENIFKEKKSLFDYVSKGKKYSFVVNGDDFYLGEMTSSNSLIRVGNSKGEILFKEVNHETIEIDFLKSKFKITNSHLIGLHNFHDLTMALTLCWMIDPNKLEEYKSGCESFKPGSNRSEIKITKDNWIFLDAYNANPSSMESSLSSFFKHIEKMKGQRQNCLVVIGDMNELGESTRDSHKKIGAMLNDLRPGLVIFVGRFYEYFKEGCSISNVVHYNNASDAEQFFLKKMTDYRFVFLKASRSVKLETLVKSLN